MYCLRAYPKNGWWFSVLQNIEIDRHCTVLLAPDRLHERMRGDPGNCALSMSATK
ncbi:MAG TPA: hypothetical protein VGT41_01735 [Candidatus Babeliales bacterium]|nr:hypothetical protein [Candidatus Babeliales bacterium]